MPSGARRFLRVLCAVLDAMLDGSFGVHQLKVAPHGVMDVNAFYSRKEEGLVLGYFPGRRASNVYTCLSHDVVVHETTHALIDALRERYMDPSGADQAAFHEGLADVVALLSVFSQAELVAELLRLPATRTRPRGYLRDQDVTAEALRKTASSPRARGRSWRSRRAISRWTRNTCTSPIGRHGR